MPFAIDSGPRLGPQEFRLLRDLINNFCGISFGNDSLFVVERRLRERLLQLGIDDFADYYAYLRYHPEAAAELERAIDTLTTNETYFYREAYQLDAFRDEILPVLADRAAARARLSVWSAGCSTGEEVYTLAMMLERCGRFEGWDLRVFGNDISRRVLQIARRGAYGPSSFRSMPSSLESYFLTSPEGRVVHPRIRAICHFAHMNLLDTSRSALLGRVDIIFCRNVLIYFDPDSRRRVIESFYDRLVPGGYLMLGHSESLLNVSTAFELVHLRSDLVYRKPTSAGLSGRPRGPR